MQTHIQPQTQPPLSEREALDCEILCLLEAEPQISQRELARRTGVSLGRANYCLQALASRGWVKFERFRQAPRKGPYLYALTPSGLVQRTRLAGGLLERKRAEYDRIKAQIALLEQQVGRGE